MGCTIVEPAVRWRELAQAPDRRIVTPQHLIDHGPVLDLNVPGQLTLRIDASDPIVIVGDVRSYAKMLRLAPSRAEVLEVIVESWCDGCKPTAVLWGAPELPVFNPHLTVFDAQGTTVEIDGKVTTQERWWRNIPLKGRWHFTVDGRRPYYMLLASADGRDRTLAFASDIADFTSSAVGKLRLHVAAAAR